jgi:hypothetical protein
MAPQALWRFCSPEFSAAGPHACHHCRPHCKDPMFLFAYVTFSQIFLIEV